MTHSTINDSTDISTSSSLSLTVSKQFSFLVTEPEDLTPLSAGQLLEGCAQGKV